MNMKKTFSKEEIRRLLVLTYIGEWVMTSNYKEGSCRAEYTEILDKMLNLAHKAGLDEYVSWQETGIEPSPLLEDECRRFLEEYEDKYFLAELAERLSEIDVEALVRHQKQNGEYLEDRP